MVMFVVLVAVALVNVVDMAGLIAVVLMGIALVRVVVVGLSVVLVAVALMHVMNVARLFPMMFVSVALVDIVFLHWLSLPDNIFGRVSPRPMPRTPTTPLNILFAIRTPERKCQPAPLGLRSDALSKGEGRKGRGMSPPFVHFLLPYVELLLSRRPECRRRRNHLG